jgi:hypothetical protein
VSSGRQWSGRSTRRKLEDLNPHLSLEVLDGATLEAFVARLGQDLHTTIEER